MLRSKSRLAYVAESAAFARWRSVMCAADGVCAAGENVVPSLSQLKDDEPESVGGVSGSWLLGVRKSSQSHQDSCGPVNPDPSSGGLLVQLSSHELL